MIEEMQKRIEELEAKLAKLEPKTKTEKPKRWRGEHTESFECVERDFFVSEYEDYRTYSDNKLFNSYNYFKPGQAKELAMIMRWSAYLYSENVRLYGKYWRPEYAQQSFYFTFEDSNFSVYGTHRPDKNEIVFKTAEDAQQAIDNMPDEIRKWAEEV